MKRRFIYQSIDISSPAEVGGKAHALMQLGKDFNIPSFIVITAQSFKNGCVLPEAQEELSVELPKLGQGLFAVRSSAVDEDGKDASFAGQLKSFLNVTSIDVIENAEAVAASANETHIGVYRERQGLNAQKTGTAVLVQQMIPADMAGVVFSADPVNADRDVIVVNATKGLADQLVSGEVSGETYILSRRGEVLKGSVGELLTDNQLRKLAELAKAVERVQGCPQDIEWAFANDTLYLLQARPITTLPSLTELQVFDNSNIVESYSGVTSPLTFSFAQYIYSEVYVKFMGLMGVSATEVQKRRDIFANLLAYIQGHVYYNLGNWYRILALFPGFQLNYRFMEQMMGVAEGLPPDLLKQIMPSKPSGLKIIPVYLSLLRLCLRFVGQALCLSSTRRAFYQRLNLALNEPAADLQKLSLIQLAGHYHDLERQLLDRWDAPLINDFICMIAFGLSRAVLQRYLGDEKGAALHADALIGQGDIVSAEPAQRLQAMARQIRESQGLYEKLKQSGIKGLAEHSSVQRAFRDYLAKFGDRCPQELKLESITLDDAPESLFLSLMALAERNTETAAAAPRQNAASLIKRELAGKPFKNVVAQTLLQWAKARVRDRENLRFERTRVFGRIRKIMLAIGARLHEQGILVDKRDVFCLTLPEVLGIIEGASVNGDIKALIELRQSQLDLWEKAIPPRARITIYGSPFKMCKATVYEYTQHPLDKTLSRIGLGCCAGIVRGKARVILDPRQESLQAGEIMVAEFTDPGWIAVFAGAAGVIVERGSLLSHSAIVARELGIPAIVNVAQATKWLKTGDEIEINGATGEIRKSYKADNSIVERAKFDIIRYAQGWEDTDILRKALQIRKGDVCLSICAAGDNTLSLLLDDPAKILAIDLSPAQLACLRLRMVMYKELNHQEFLELFGSIKSDTRMAFLDRCTKHLSDEDNVMWHNYRKNIQAYGIGGIGKFERYFRIFRTCILPLVHSRQTISDLLTEKPQNERELFYNRTWNSFTWRMLLRGFFSRTMMGRLGRDPAFFSYVTGSVADHVMRRVKHAFTELNPSENPYLFWILTGRHQHALPVALRQENYDIIRSRLDRVTVMQTDIERLPSLGFRFNAYNLSDIFEYMSAAYFEKIYSILLACAAPQARMAYWNMMVPRAVPERFRNLINSDFDLAQMLHNEDKTFFYDRFVVEQVKERLA